MAAHRLVSAHDELVKTQHHVKPLVLLPIADGSEDLEVLTIYDTLTRGGADVVTASVGEKKMNIIMGAYSTKIRAAKAIEDCTFDRYALIVLPGGIGAAKLRDCDVLARMLKLQKQENRYYAAIGDAPAIVFAAHDLLDGHATCHPTKVRLMGEQFVDKDVVVSGHCVTGQGAGTAMAFALKLVELVCSADEEKTAAKQLLYPLA